MQLTFSTWQLAFYCGAAIVLMAIETPGASGEPKSPEQSPAAIDWSKLIDDLASRNKPPLRVRDDNGLSIDILFGEEFDWDDQARLLKAFRVLGASDSEESLKELLRHEDDKRYSLTTTGNINLTVGDLCSTLVSNRIDRIYKQHIPRNIHGRRMPLDFDFDPREWIAKHPDAPLVQVQTNLCEAAIHSIGELEASDPRAKKIWKETRIGIESELERLKRTGKAFFKPCMLSDIYEIVDANLAQEVQEKYKDRPIVPFD